MRISTTLLFSTLLFHFVIAQYDHQAVFSDLEGQALLDELVDSYKTSVVLSYGEARDVIYTEIDNVNDNVSCIYTGHTLFLPPNEEPRPFLLMDGMNNGINAEHTYPQSRGAGSGNPRR